MVPQQHREHQVTVVADRRCKRTEYILCLGSSSMLALVNVFVEAGAHCSMVPLLCHHDPAGSTCMRFVNG